MVEFKIQLEDTFVQTFGYKEIDKSLQEFVQKIVTKVATQDILKDQKAIDLENDKEWQLSRTLAWQQEEHKYSCRAVS